MQDEKFRKMYENYYLRVEFKRNHSVSIIKNKKEQPLEYDNMNRTPKTQIQLSKNYSPQVTQFKAKNNLDLSNGKNKQTNTNKKQIAINIQNLTHYSDVKTNPNNKKKEGSPVKGKITLVPSYNGKKPQSRSIHKVIGTENSKILNQTKTQNGFSM